MILRQCAILIVLFGNVRCTGNDKLCGFVNKAQQFWGITKSCLYPDNDNEPLLIIKLKELVVPMDPRYPHTGNFDHAYIIYGSDRNGKYFELAVVFENGQEGLHLVRVDTTTVATSIARLSFNNMQMDSTLVKQNLVKIRARCDDEFKPYYRLFFESYDQAKEIYDKYAAYWPKQAPLPLGLKGDAAPGNPFTSTSPSSSNKS